MTLLHLLFSLLSVVVSISNTQAKSFSNSKPSRGMSHRSLQQEMIVREAPLQVGGGDNPISIALDGGNRGKSSQDTKDKNYERRKKRKNKKKTKKCKGVDDSLPDGKGKGKGDYRFVDCPPTYSPAPTVTGSPTWSPTTTPVPTSTAFPTKGSPPVDGQGGAPSPVVTPTIPTQPVPAAPVPIEPVPTEPVGTGTDGTNSDSSDETNSDSTDGTNSDSTDGTNSDGTDGSNSDGTEGTNSDSTDGTNSDGTDGSGTGVIPAVTSAPVTTATVTMTPIPSAADEELRAACDAISNGEVYQTDQKYDISYYYELVTPLDAEFAEVVGTLEQKVAAFIASFVVPCKSLRRLQHRQLRPLGVGPGDLDEQADGRCTALETIDDQSCYFMEGTLEFFVSEGSSYTKTEAAEFSYQILQAAFNKGAVLAEHPFLDDSQGILGLYFHGAFSTETGTETLGTPAAAERSVPVNDSNNLGGLGIGIVVAACLSVLVVGLFAMKRRGNHFDKNRGVQLGDTGSDISLGSANGNLSFEKMTEMGSNDDESSYGQSVGGPGLPGKILSDEDNSIFSGLQDIPVEPRSKFEKSLRDLGPIFVPCNKGHEVPLSSIYATRDYQTSNTVDL